ncbi:MAG TPA: hypothetical protein VGS20_02135 [Candidatus Acidoferrales bacterium]|nr:hypothetical protein [Candidatus Acidoferrales bacterium]
MRRSDPSAHGRRPGTIDAAKNERNSQVVFGERQYLLRVLDSIEDSGLAAEQRGQEQRALERMIYARTQELNRMNPGWDEKVGIVLRPDVTPAELDTLVRAAPEADYFLLRLVSEHPRATAETLARLARHPSTAIRENVARHTNASAKTLVELSRDRSQPLWYLVAFNPSAPAALRERLMSQVKHVSRKSQPK